MTNLPNILLCLTMLSIDTYTEEWHDTARDRTVPVRIFLPDAARHSDPCPVVLLSHGLGGSREGFGYLGEDWAKHGYIAIVMQHIGSDISIHLNRGKSRETTVQRMQNAVNAQTAQDRYDDVVFVLDELERRNDFKAIPQPPAHNHGTNDRAAHFFGGQSASHPSVPRNSLKCSGRF